ncbi:nucleoside diphosphate kinase regulator [Paraglaciecola sp. Hal342]|jgi:regulator of nucleoside diphosphate kinase
MQPNIIISTADLAELEYQLERAKLPTDTVRAIENELDRASIVACKDLPENVVAIGSKVTFKILDSQKIFTKTLCLPHDTIKYEDSISVFAPIGSALIGLSTGQCITWQTQRGEQSVEIINVESNKR